MRMLFALTMTCLSHGALACGLPVCLVDPQSLGLTRIITFDDIQSGNGPGRLIAETLVLPGAIFGERFAGQSVHAAGDHDAVTGTALPPLTVLPGAAGENLSVVYFQGNNILNGYGKAGFPNRHAQGEGAIAFVFDADQSALSFQIRGGEAGGANVMFFRRDGSVISAIDLPSAGEHAFGFERRTGDMDIAGILLTNTDPQGLALDNIRFGRPPDVS